MGTFSYKAINKEGKMVSGMLEISDRAAVMAHLAKQDLRPISITQSAVKKGLMNIRFGGKVKTKDLVVFTRQLSTMISAGVPLIRSITTLQSQAENQKFKEVLDAVNKDVQSGTSLGDAFGKHPRVFSDVFVNMVRAGEAGGILDDILKRLAEQQEKNDSIRKKVKGAMTYPTVLIVITTLAFFGLMFFVVPMIGGILKDLGGPDAELPAITQVMLDISGFMRDRWYILLAVFGIGGFLLARYLRSPKGKSKFHHFILKVPAIGGIVRKLAVARFARTFASLLGAGVSVLEALHVTGRAIGNKAYEEALTKAAEGVKNGKQLSQTLSGSKLFPEIIPQMISVGEETGKTDEVLIKVADFYEEEVDTAINGISSIIEPVMILIMGAMVGLIAASVMGPIASLSNNIKG
jgi:type IV pilus assembly protein PilC